MKRRAFVRLCAAAPLAGSAGYALADVYPDKPIRVIVPYATGGGTDTIARDVMQRVGEVIGEPMVIENRAGAGTSIGLAELAHAKPDGYTLGVGGSSDPWLPLLYDKLSFNPTTDLEFVCTLATVPIVLVAGPQVPVNSVADLIAFGKRHPETPMAYGSAGIASPHHLAGLLFASEAGIPLNHVAYKGTGPALVDVLAGHVDLGMLGLPNVLPYARDGKLKILGVASAGRSALAPDIPTIAEAGLKGFEASYWWDVSVPAGTPKPIIEKLQKEITGILRKPEVQESLAKKGFEVMILSREEAQRALKEDTVKWTKVIRDSQIRAPQ